MGVRLANLGSLRQTVASMRQPKKPLSPAQLEQRRKAGLARAKGFTKEHQSLAGKARAKAFTSEYQSRAWLAKLAKLGTQHLSEMGKRGWQAAFLAQPDFYEQGGESSRLLILALKERRIRERQAEHDTSSGGVNDN